FFIVISHNDLFTSYFLVSFLIKAFYHLTEPFFLEISSSFLDFCSFLFFFSPVLASINSLVPRNFTFFLVVLGLLYLFSIYFYSSYSVMKISYQMFCPKL